MRQAGRYLPSYQALRKKHSLYDLFFTPDLALQATLLPVDEIGVDAAILFSDITVIVKALGMQLDFKEGIGPVIEPRIECASQIDNLPSPSMESLEPIAETIRLLRKELKVPLIGFCGGPFTVASYMIERKSGSDLPLIKRWLYCEPQSLHRLLRRLTDATKDYLDLQIDNGAQAIQVFDSWAHVLTLPDLQTFCLPYHRELIEHVQQRGVPAISFMRSSCLHIQEIAAFKPDAISCDWQRPLSAMRKAIGPEIALQGNLDPDLLFAPLDLIESKTRELLASMDSDPGFIVNLGHGVKPEIPWQSVRHFVAVVKSYKSAMAPAMLSV
jgi:uroporphyrinogen decarboxylase